MADQESGTEPTEDGRLKLGEVAVEQVVQYLNITEKTKRYLKQEIGEARKAPAAFFVIAVISVLIASLISFKISAIELQAYASRANEDLLSYRRQSETIEKYRLLVTELQSRISGLLPEEVAKQIATNLPPDQRTDVVIEKLAELTKGDSYEIRINGVLVDLAEPMIRVQLTTDRTFVFQFHNRGVRAINSAQFILSGSLLYKTNVSADGWENRGSQTLTRKEADRVDDLGQVPSWWTRPQFPVIDDMIWSAPPVHFRSSTHLPTMVFLTISTERSSKRTLRLLIAGP